MIGLLAVALLNLQPPVSVCHVHNLTKVDKIEDRDVVFGCKETVEQILSDKDYVINDSTGECVDVNITSIESPEQILNIFGLKWLKKEYIVTTEIFINNKSYKGTAKKTTYLFAALLDVENNKVPLNRKAFSKALQKSLSVAMNNEINVT